MKRVWGGQRRAGQRPRGIQRPRAEVGVWGCSLAGQWNKPTLVLGVRRGVMVSSATLDRNLKGWQGTGEHLVPGTVVGGTWSRCAQVRVERERGVGGRPSYRLAARTGPELQGLDRWHIGVVKSAGRFLATRSLLALSLSPVTPAGVGVLNFSGYCEVTAPGPSAPAAPPKPPGEPYVRAMEAHHLGGSWVKSEVASERKQKCRLQCWAHGALGPGAGGVQR